jgi:hypothetical protein
MRQLAEEIARIDLLGPDSKHPIVQEILRIMEDYGDDEASLMEEMILRVPDPAFTWLGGEEFLPGAHNRKMDQSEHLNEVLREIVAKFPRIRNKRSNA